MIGNCMLRRPKHSTIEVVAPKEEGTNVCYSQKNKSSVRRVGVCHHDDVQLLPHATSATRNVGAILDHLGTAAPTAQTTPHLCSAIRTEQFFTACRSPSISACLKQFMPQISAVWARSQNCEKRLLASSCLSDRPSVHPSARLSARNNSAYTGRIFKKVDICVFFENVSGKSQFH